VLNVSPPNIISIYTQRSETRGNNMGIGYETGYGVKKKLPLNMGSEMLYE
jgi:hypothetical protein